MAQAKKMPAMDYRVRGKILIHFVLILGSVLMIFPFIWMMLTSVKGLGESMLIPPTFLPKVWRFDNYTEVLRTLPFDKLHLNTLLLMFWRILCASVFSSMAGFAFAKLQFPGKKLFFFIVLTQLMLPSQIFIIPQYLMLSKMGQRTRIFALVFPGLVSAFGTFFLKAVLYEPSESADGSVGARRLQRRPDIPSDHDAADAHSDDGAGSIYRAVCLQRHDVAADREYEYR